MNKLYSAVVSGKNKVDVFDVNKGVKSYSLNLGSVDIVNGPIITKDKLTIVVKSINRTTGRVYNLSTGTLSYSFIIQ
jgi:hypothetical protein